MSIIKLFIAQLMGSILVNLFKSICYGILVLRLFVRFDIEIWRAGYVLWDPTRVSVPHPHPTPTKCTKIICGGKRRGKRKRGALKKGGETISGRRGALAHY